MPHDQHMLDSLPVRIITESMNTVHDWLLAINMTEQSKSSGYPLSVPKKSYCSVTSSQGSLRNCWHAAEICTFVLFTFYHPVYLLYLSVHSSLLFFTSFGIPSVSVVCLPGFIQGGQNMKRLSENWMGWLNRATKGLERQRRQRTRCPEHFTQYQLWHTILHWKLAQIRKLLQLSAAVGKPVVIRIWQNDECCPLWKAAGVHFLKAWHCEDE